MNALKTAAPGTSLSASSHSLQCVHSWQDAHASLVALHASHEGSMPWPLYEQMFVMHMSQHDIEPHSPPASHFTQSSGSRPSADARPSLALSLVACAIVQFAKLAFCWLVKFCVACACVLLGPSSVT